MNVPFNIPDKTKQPTTINSEIFNVMFQSFNENPIKYPIITIAEPIKNDNFNCFHPLKNFEYSFF